MQHFRIICSVRSETPVSDHFGMDLNCIAIGGKVDPVEVVGRNKKLNMYHRY
jgi:hypothetical protein